MTKVRRLESLLRMAECSARTSGVSRSSVVVRGTSIRAGWLRLNDHQSMRQGSGPRWRGVLVVCLRVACRPSF